MKEQIYLGNIIMNEEVNGLMINEEDYKLQLDRDMYSNLKFGSVGDTTDEFIKSREILSQGDLIFEYKNYIFFDL